MFVNTYSPRSFVIVVRLIFVRSLVSVTSTPGTTPRLEGDRLDQDPPVRWNSKRRTISCAITFAMKVITSRISAR